MKKIYTLLLGVGVALNVVAQMQISQGKEVYVKAFPKPGFKFIQWSNGNTENPYAITVMDNVDLVAIFDYNDYTLTTRVNYTDGGTVSSGGSVQYTKTKELTATPNYGYVFKNWTVSGSGSSVSSTTANPTTFTMGTANATVTANFDYDQFEITAITGQPHMGTVSGSGSYNYLSEQYVTATPLDARYRFVSWSDGNTDNPRTITVTEDVDLVAIFDYNDYTLTTQVNYSDRGIVSSGGSVQYTQTKELTATPNYGYVFKNWTVSGSGSSVSSTTANPTIFTMGTENATVTANFDYDKFDITAIAEQPQMGTVSGSGRYNYLSEQYVTVTPLDARYRFVSWSDGNTENPRFITITQDETYMAIFEQTHAILTAKPSEKNAGTFVGPGLYEVGEKVFLQANPAPYYRFVKWSDGSTQNPRRITMTGDITLTAYFVDELAEESFVNPGQVLVEPDSTNAKFSWPQTEGSKSYSLEIKKDGVVFCTLEFNEYGQLAGIDFTTRAMTKGFQFKVTGLEEDSDYRFSLKAKDVSDNVIASYAGDFSTRAGSGSSVGESNLGEEEDNPGGGNGGEGTAVSENAHTVLAYGLDMQVIVKGAFAQTISVYNVVGQLLETRVASSDTEIFNVYPEGVYIVNVGEETYKVVVK